MLTTVTLEDRGDEIAFKPVPDDPIEAAAGSSVASSLGLKTVELPRQG